MNKKRTLFSMIAILTAVISCNLPGNQAVQEAPNNLSSQQLAGTITAVALTPAQSGQQAPSETFTPIVPQITETASVTPTLCVPTAVANINAHVRNGPGTDYKSIDSITSGTSLSIAGRNDENTWWYISYPSASGGHGWIAMSVVTTSCVPATVAVIAALPTTPVDNKKSYRVIRSSIQVLDGAASTANLVGMLYYGEIVEGIGPRADGTWQNIRKTDGSLVGWTLSKDLLSADVTRPPLPENPPTPAPEDSDKKWYQVGYASLTVRDTPNVTGKVLGTVFLDDTLPALDDTTTPGWIQIRRVDGLTGWVENKFLVFLSNTRPASIRQNLYDGVTYLQKDITTPRKNRIHVIEVDLITTGLQFLVTPSTNSGSILCTRTVSKFLEEFGMSVAINGDGFSYFDASVSPISACPNGGDPVRANGFAASSGNIYSPTKTVQPTIYISSTNQVTVNAAPTKVFNAISGDRIVVQDGLTVKNLAAQVPSPRTAIGLNENGRSLILMVVDGRQPGYSEGVTFPELADLLISYGVYTGVNMDGGGSSALDIKGVDGKARLLNSPIDQNVPGKERTVSNHLGLLIK